MQTVLEKIIKRKFKKENNRRKKHENEKNSRKRKMKKKSKQNNILKNSGNVKPFITELFRLSVKFFKNPFFLI